MMRLALFALMIALGLPAAGRAGLAAQGAAAAAVPAEPRLLADAQRREAVGDLPGSERVLRELLVNYPTSTGGLFAYERVLRRQGRVGDVLPAVDRFLALEEGAAGPNLLKLRVLVELDSLREARAAADAWMVADPESPDPYREAAALFQEAFGPEEALATLRRGSAALERPLLAVETADILLQMGDHSAAMQEWSRALGDEGAQLPAILERVGRMSVRERSAVRDLVQGLGRSPTTPDRQRAGAQIAVEAGFEDDALALAQGIVPGMTEGARTGFLASLARQAEARRMDGMTLWIYRTMREAATEPGERLALDRQIVALAAAVGDTALALSAQERLATGLPQASDDRRRAAANTVRLSVAVDPPAVVQARFDRFRADYPGAGELDELAVGLARLWSDRDDPEAAQRVLRDLDGPRSALQRALLSFEADAPDLEAAKLDLAIAAEGLAGTGATEVIQLLALVNRVGEGAAMLGGRAAALAHRGQSRRAVELVAEGVSEHPREAQPPLLALGARIASAAPDSDDLAEQATSLLSTIVRDFPDAPEAPEAMLALARRHLRTGGPAGADEAERLLETLILTRTESPVVPDARRELQRLRQPSPDEGGAEIPGGER